MDKQIIDEIDIIVRAKVEEARENIRSVAKETTKMVNTVSKNFQKMDKEGNLEQLSGTMKDYKKEIKNVSDEVRKIKVTNNGLESSLALKEYKKEIKEIGKEIRKIKVHDNGIEFSFTPGADDFEKNRNEAIDRYEEEQQKLEEELQAKYPATSIESSAEMIRDNSSKSNQQPKKIPPIKFDDLSLKEQYAAVWEELKKAVPIVQEVTSAIKERFNDTTSVFGLLKLKVQDFKTNLASVKEQIQNVIDIKVDNFLDKIKPVRKAVNSVTDTLKKLEPVTQMAGKAIKNTFTTISSHVSKPIGKIKEFINKIKSAGSETDKTKKKGKGFGDNFAKGLSAGISSIKKFALSLFSIRTAFSAVSKAAQAYLSFDDQLSESIQNCWNVLGSLLAPILEYVASLFSKLVSVVAALVQALTGIDLVARANSKALDKQAKSTKNAAKASNQLSSIDDISTLTSDSGNNKKDDFTPITTESVDLSPLESAIDKTKGVLSQIFNPFKEAWESTGTGVIQSIIEAFDSIKQLGADVGTSLLEVWTNGTGTEIITNALTGVQLLFDIIGGISTALSEAWTNAGNGTKIVQNIADIFKTIQQMGLRIGELIKAWVVSDGFKTGLNLVFTIISDITKWLKDTADWILKMYDTYFKPVIDEKLLPALKSIADMFTAIWNVAKPIIDKIIDNVKKYLEPVIAGLAKTLGGIIDIVKGIADFVTGVFTGNWRKAWNGVKDIVVGIFNTIKSAISTVWNAIWGIIKGVINTIISGFESFINFVIKGLNKLLDPLRKLGNGLFDILGANIEIPKISNVKIPRLWTGHVATEPLIAEVGEYANAKQNPEIISPVSMMKSSFRDVLSEVDFGGTRIDRLCIDVAGENFYDDTIDYINDKSERKGVSVIKEV